MLPDGYKRRSEETQAFACPETIKKQQLEQLFVSRKYNNTKETALYKKSRTLLNFDQAKKSSSESLLVFEGNPDCVTLFAGGVKVATATCGTAFTAGHLDVILAAGITRLTLVYDPDKGRKEGTERFVKMLD